MFRKKKGKGYTSIPFSFNRRMVIAAGIGKKVW
jgi:hypothetical protein